MGTTKPAMMNIDEPTVRSGIKALFNIIKKNKNDKTLFEDELAIFLQFSSIKVGRTPSRTLRIPLSHSLLKDSEEVCLIVEDMKGRKPKEYEQTVEHYENLLREKGITNIKTIMTYFQLRTDYSEFELKRKLVELYDIFLVDGKLSGYVVKKLGKIFRNKRKLPIPVRLEATNLKEHLKFALSKTSTNLHPHGDNFVIQIAHSAMNEDQIYENIIDVCKTLSKEFPGGWINIRSLNIKTPKSISIPIYYTLKNSSTLSVPVIKAKRPKAFKAVTDELSTAYDKKVTVLPTGEVILKKTKPIDQNRLTRKRKANEKDDKEPNITDKDDENLSEDSLGELSGGSDEELDEFDEYDQVEVPKQRKIVKLKKKQDMKIKKPKISKVTIKKKAKVIKETAILEETSNLPKVSKNKLSENTDDIKVPKRPKLVKLKPKKKVLGMKTSKLESTKRNKHERREKKMENKTKKKFSKKTI